MSDFTANFALTEISFLNANVIANQVKGTASTDAVYANLIKPFLTVFNLDDNSTIPTGDTNGTYESQFSAAIVALNSVIQNGVASQSVPGQTDYLTVQMVNAVAELYKTLEFVGINVSNPGVITNQQIADWKSLSTIASAEVVPVMQNLVGASFSAKSEQAMTELVYVKTGNDLLTGVLQSMKDALNLTAEILTTLNDLQVLHNKITVGDKIPFSQFFPSLNQSVAPDPGAWVLRYKEAASAYFNSPVVPTITMNLTSGGVQFLSLKKHIESLIKRLSNATPIDTEEQANQTLLGQLKIVYNDMQRAISQAPFNSPSMAFQLWMMDNQDPVNNKLSGLNNGDVQQHITNAITGSESLNDTQKQDVQRYLFIFQEFYKSASAILTALSQVIQSMAQKIAR